MHAFLNMLTVLVGAVPFKPIGSIVLLMPRAPRWCLCIIVDFSGHACSTCICCVCGSGGHVDLGGLCVSMTSVVMFMASMVILADRLDSTVVYAYRAYWRPRWPS